MAQAFAARIRGYWGAENKLHYVRDVTRGRECFRIRTLPLVQIGAIALNLYQDKLLCIYSFSHQDEVHKFLCISGFSSLNIYLIYLRKAINRLELKLN